MTMREWPLAVLGVSVPVIVLGPVFVWLFGVTLKWLPPTGWGSKPPYVFGFFPSTFNWNYVRSCDHAFRGVGRGPGSHRRRA